MDGWMDGWVGGMDEWDKEDGLTEVRVREAQESEAWDVDMRRTVVIPSKQGTRQSAYLSYKQCKVAAAASTAPSSSSSSSCNATRKVAFLARQSTRSQNGVSARGLVHVRACTSNTDWASYMAGSARVCSSAVMHAVCSITVVVLRRNAKRIGASMRLGIPGAWDWRAWGQKNRKQIHPSSTGSVPGYWIPREAIVGSGG